MNPRRWYGYLLDRWDALRGSYWFFPAQMAVLSGALALATIEFDRRVPLEGVLAMPWLTGVSADGARAVLSTIAGSMMTVTGVVFSITVVALTLTSSQFGPRLLRTFFRDRSSQFALGTFLSTFFYSLLVLRAVGSPDRVPYVATAGAVLLAVVSLFVLIFFIHHTANSLQASSVIAAVACEIREQIPVLFPEALGKERAAGSDHGDEERLAALGEEVREIFSAGEGYVRILDDEATLALACEHDLLIWMDACPGEFVGEGSRIARVAPAAKVTDEVAAALRGCCILGDHRTPVQDVGFLVEQLSEMAVRALSPGVNDPKTAVECIHRLGSLIARLAPRSFPSGRRFDDADVLRVVVAPTRFDDIVSSCLDSIRLYGADDPQVASALLRAVAAGVEGAADASRREVLQEHAREIHAAFERSRERRSDRDRARVAAAYERVRVALGAAAIPEGGTA